MFKPKVLAICGSTRAASSNLSILKYLQETHADSCEIRIFRDLELIPAFNPDKEASYAVERFREQIRQSDGIIICTPEYAMGVPGALKNAIDWTVGSADLYRKPLALITASSIGEKAHAALLETLKVLETKTPPALQLLISFVNAKIDKTGQITDKYLPGVLRELMLNLVKEMAQNPVVEG